MARKKKLTEYRNTNMVEYDTKDTSVSDEKYKERLYVFPSYNTSVMAVSHQQAIIRLKEKIHE